MGMAPRGYGAPNRPMNPRMMAGMPGAMMAGYPPGKFSAGGTMRHAAIAFLMGWDLLLVVLLLSPLPWMLCPNRRANGYAGSRAAWHAGRHGARCDPWWLAAVLDTCLPSPGVARSSITMPSVFFLGFVMQALLPWLRRHSLRQRRLSLCSNNRRSSARQWATRSSP
jgi:hypothetical protein